MFCFLYIFLDIYLLWHQVLGEKFYSVVFQEHLTKDDARQQFLRILRTLPYGNSVFFCVRKIDDPIGLLPGRIVLGINKRGVGIKIINLCTNCMTFSTLWSIICTEFICFLICHRFIFSVQFQRSTCILLSCEI